MCLNAEIIKMTKFTINNKSLSRLPVGMWLIEMRQAQPEPEAALFSLYASSLDFFFKPKTY